MTESDRIQLFIREGEGLTIEFKERFTPRIVEDIVAFANARGGSIILGVRDNGTTVGEKLDNSLKARILSLARNCSPSIEISTRQIGDWVEVSIPEGLEKPYGCSAGYFRRLDAATQKMSDRELRLMFQSYGGIPFEDRVCREASFKDLSPLKIRSFLKRIGINTTKPQNEALLRSLKLVRDDGITYAASSSLRNISIIEVLSRVYTGTTNMTCPRKLSAKPWPMH